MPAKKYLAMVAGRQALAAGVVVSTGAPNDGDLVAYGADGKLDASVFPAGFGQNNVSALASEALTANDVVNLWNNAGTPSVRKADGTAIGKEAHGFVKANFANAASATVFLPGNVMASVGLTPGARYYLATVAGGVSITPLVATGNIHQLVGVAANATTLVFEPEDPVTM
jgi:hypothetical protein